MEREHLQKLDVSWGHEPRQLVGRGVLTAPRPGGLRTDRPTLRFMERCAQINPSSFFMVREFS